MNLTDYHSNLPFSFSGKNIVYKAFPNVPRKLIDKKLAESEIYTKFKEHKKIKTSPVYVYNKRDLFQADLAFFTDPELIKASNGMRYLLVIIDCFTKVIWLFPLADKSCQTVSKKFKDLFENIDQIPKKIQTDQGTEFLCAETKKVFDDYNIFHYVTHSDRKASIAERVIKTIKDLIEETMKYENTNNWVDVLPNVRKIYLTRYHRSIKMTPLQAELEENQFLVRSHAHKRYGRYKIEKKRKFKVGDTVRLYGLRGVFKRGYQQNFTDEYFIIHKVKSILPKSQYYLKDLKGRTLKGNPAFFENELTLFIPTADTLYKIDEIIGERVLKNGKIQKLVTWVGWPKDFTDWIDANEIQNI